MKAALLALFLTTQTAELDIDLPPEIGQACEAGGGCVLITQRALQMLVQQAQSCGGTRI